MISLRSLVENKISEIQNLATLPGIATEIMGLTESDRSSMKEISKIIEKDMTIAAKILKIANSPLYGYQRKIDKIKKTLVILGIKEVYNIVVGISVYSTFVNLKNNSDFNRDEFWDHSAGVGRIAKVFADGLGLKFDGAEFLAGLVHDVGKLILDQYFQREFSQILSFMQEKDVTFEEAESELFDINHAEIGSMLMERWNVPENVTYSVRYHHAPELAKNYREITCIIHIANELDNIWGDSSFGKPHSFSLTDNLGWKILKESYPSLDQFDIERFTYELSEEIAKAKDLIAINKNG